MNTSALPHLTFCCGTGGVGKTTVSAALSVRLAQEGARTAVLTIDPSKRLRTALGLEATRTGRVDLPSCPGLTAVIPPQQRTFDALLEALAPASSNASMLAKMRSNSLYQTLSGEYSGAHEFLALVLLYDLIESRDFDHIVIDTPPAQNAAAFFQAPERMLRLFDEQIVQWVSQGMGAGLTLFQKLLGQTFLGSAIEFFRMLDSVQHALKDRLRAAQSWVAAPQTEFWLITTPVAATLPSIGSLTADLQQRGTHLHRCVLNRSLSHLQPIPPDVGCTSEARAWVEAHLAWEARQEAQLRELGQLDISRLPEEARDVHSWEDLQHVAHRLSSDCLRLPRR